MTVNEGSRVSVDAIASAPKENVTENNGISATDPYTNRDQKLDQHLGTIGRLIGGGPEKAGNIAGLVIAVSLIMIVLGSIATAMAGSEKIATVFDRVVTGAISLITGALGYIFGKGGSEK